MRKHQLNRPGFGNRLRTGEGFRMRRLAGGERSTRFEPASQHSQLPLLRTRGLPSKSTFDACVSRRRPDNVFWTLFKTPITPWGQSFPQVEPNHRIQYLSANPIPMQNLSTSNPFHVHFLQSWSHFMNLINN